MAKVSFQKPGGPPSIAPAPKKSPATAPVPTQQPPVKPAPPTPQPTSTPPAPPVAPAIPVQTPDAATGAAEPEVLNENPPVEADVVPSADAGTVPYTPPPPPVFYDGAGIDFDPSDLVLPRLNIVQKVGELSNVYPGGTVLLGGQLVLVEAGKELQKSAPIRFVVLGLRPTTYAEKVEGGGRGQYFRTKEEVVAAGGTLDWNEAQVTDKPLYQPVTIGLLAIEQPAGANETSFPDVIDGKRYALSLYTMKGTAYTNAARHIKSALNVGSLRITGLRGHFWTFQSQLKKFGSNYAYIPVLTPAELTTSAWKADMEKLVAGFKS